MNAFEESVGRRMIIWQPGMTLEDVERYAILSAQRHFDNNKAAMSRALGCTVNTIASKLASYDERDRLLLIAADERKKDEETFNLRARGKLPPSPHYSLESNQGNGIQRTECGLAVESAAETSGLASVLLSEPDDVRDLLPSKHPDSRKGKGRGAI